jgi:Plavaka transposase
MDSNYSVVSNWENGNPGFRCLLSNFPGHTCNFVFLSKRSLLHHQSQQHESQSTVERDESISFSELRPEFCNMSAVDCEHPVASISDLQEPVPDIIQSYGLREYDGMPQPRQYSDVFRNELVSFFSACFGSAHCLESKSLEEFIIYVQTHGGLSRSVDSGLTLQLLSLSSKVHISRTVGAELLRILKSVAAPHVVVPSNWRNLDSDLQKSLPGSYKYQVVQYPWPEKFKMSEWRQPGLPPPSQVTFRVRSVLQLLSFKLNDPIIMLKYRDHVSLEPVELRDSNGNRIVKDVVSSPWFHETTKALQQRERLRNPKANPKAIAISIYNDGVAMGFKNKFSAWPVMMTLGNFSSELQQHDIAKDIIAYVPELGISETVLESHLRDIAGLSKTAAGNAVKTFKRKLIHIVMEVICREISYGATTGIKIPVLGTGQEYELYTFISSLPGDIPARCALSGVYQNRCANCHEPDVKILPLNYERNIPRSMMQIPELCDVAQESDRERRRTALKQLQTIGVHPETNPLHEAPYGSCANIFTASSPDIMHTVFGLAKIVMFDILVVISTIAESDDVQFKGATALFDKRIILLSENAIKLPHLPNETFPNGLMNMAKEKSSKKERNVSGNVSGGCRSASFMAMLWYTYFAISVDGSVLPNVPNFHYKCRQR